MISTNREKWKSAILTIVFELRVVGWWVFETLNNERVVQPDPSYEAKDNVSLDERPQIFCFFLICHFVCLIFSMIDVENISL